MGEFRMPSLGADMERGTVLEWRVAPGDEVHRGDIVAVIDTEKSDIEVEIFEDGVIERIVVPVGDEVEVGALLATVAAVGAEVAVPVAESAGAPRRPCVDESRPPGPIHARAPEPAVLSPLVRHRAEELGVAVAALHGSGPGGVVTRADVEHRAAPPAGARRRASPLARRLARERGVDLEAVRGTGPGGAVIAADLATPVEAPPPAASPAAPTPAPVSPSPDAAMAAVGALMARSKREIPHYYLGWEVDLSRTVQWLEAHNRGANVADRILPVAVLLRATALAAVEVPSVNGWWRDGRFEPAGAVDLGVAVARRGGGLIAPAIVGADAMPLVELMRALSDLLARAKAGRLRASEMRDPSITVTNLGDNGADSVLPVIYPPQVAMVGVGRIAERPWAENGMVGARPTVHLTFAGDHRVTNGHEGSRFLRALDHLLQQPEVL